MNQERHPFFHTMVVVSSMLVGCGGVATSQSDDLEDGGSPDEGDDGGTPDETDVRGSGGAYDNGGSTGGEIDLGTGGTINGARLPEFPCTTEQWDCSGTPPSYYYGDIADNLYVDGFAVPADCTCDEERPISPEDCQPGEQLTCWRLAYLDEETPLDQTYLLGCECLPREENHCSDQCVKLAPNLAGYGDGINCEVKAEPSLTLCGDAWVFLR